MDAMWVIFLLVSILFAQLAMFALHGFLLAEVVFNLRKIVQINQVQINEEIMGDYNKESSRVFFKTN